MTVNNNSTLNYIKSYNFYYLEKNKNTNFKNVLKQPRLEMSAILIQSDKHKLIMKLKRNLKTTALEFVCRTFRN